MIGTVKKWLGAAFMATAALVAAPVFAGEVSQRPMAWAHYVPWHLPQDVSLAAINYYNYPLQDVVDAPMEAFRREFATARQQGIDGFFCDVVAKKDKPPVFGDTIERMLEAARGTDFQIGICLDVKITTDYQIREVAKLLERLASHPNYPHYQGRPMVCTYTYLAWTPQEWRTIRQGLKEKGWDIHLMANFATGYDRKGMDMCREYLPELESIYLFSLPGLNGVPVDKTNEFYVRETAQAGKLFIPCIYPGYYGAWLNGRNPFYIIHRHFDTAHDTLQAALQVPGKDLMYTTWNDHDETSFMPMLFTGGNPVLTAAYTAKRKGTLAPTARPEVLLAAPRECPAGTLLRLEILSLPAKAPAPIVVSGVLVNSTGKTVATLPEKRLSPQDFQRDEWQVDSLPLVKEPLVTPVITIQQGNLPPVTRRFPEIYWVTGPLLNAVTCKTAISQLTPVEESLQVECVGENTLKIRQRFSSTKAVRRVTLFRNDRPIAVPSNGQSILPLMLEIPNGTFEMQVKDGEIAAAARKFRANGSGEFSYDAKKLLSQRNLSWMPVAVRLIGTPQSQVQFRHGKETVALTYQQLAQQGRVKVGNALVHLSVVDATTQNEKPQLRSHEELEYTLLAPPSHPEDRFQVRYDFADGTFAWSRPVYPLSPGGLKEIPLLRTPINLETPSGPNGPHHVREFLGEPLFTESTAVTAAVSPLMRRRSHWHFQNDGVDSRGNLPQVSIPAALFGEGLMGAGLHFTGKKKLRMPQRTMFIGCGALEFAVKPDRLGVKQSIISHSGDSQGLAVNLLPDGQVEVLHLAGKMPQRLLSRGRLQPGKWQRLRIEHRVDHLVLKVDGRMDSQQAITPLRLYGNSTWYVGGGHPGYENLQGGIDELIMDSFPDEE